MDNFSQYDDRLTRYLLNELTADEEKELLEWIAADESRRAYFDRFTTAWNLTSLLTTLETVDPATEWKEHQRRLEQGAAVVQMNDYFPVVPGLQESRYDRLQSWLRFTAVAACSAVVIGAAAYWMRDERVSETPQRTASAKVMAPAVSVFRTAVNNAAMPENLLLEDGSTVVLYPGSELKYDSRFAGNARQVWLEGKADFNVAKNRDKPFVVFHGDIATYVLGTRFNITSPQKGSTQRVRLYEGKVLVKTIATGSRDSFYLAPGQELVFNTRRHAGYVHAFGNRPTRDDAANAQEDISLTDVGKGPWFMFNNQALPEVLQQLQILFNVPIEYNSADLRKMYFIGKFDGSDSLDRILGRMAVLYNLKVTRHQGKYTISK